MKLTIEELIKPQSLTTNGSLDLIFLGTGSAFSKLHYQNNLLILFGEDHLLIDCGTKCPQVLYDIGLKTPDIRNYFITHSHADHIGGLEEAALMGRYMTHRKPRIFITENYEAQLWEYSLKGGSAFNEHGYSKPLFFSDFFDVTRPEPILGSGRERYRFSCGAIQIEMMRTRHIPATAQSWSESVWSTGALIQEKILFTSDTMFDPELIFFYNDAYKIDVIFHDCQLFAGGVHTYLEDLRRLPAKIKEKTYLMHYGDSWKSYEQKVRDYGFPGFVQQQKIYRFSK